MHPVTSHVYKLVMAESAEPTHHEISPWLFIPSTIRISSPSESSGSSRRSATCAPYLDCLRRYRFSWCIGGTDLSDSRQRMMLTGLIFEHYRDRQAVQPFVTLWMSNPSRGLVMRDNRVTAARLRRCTSVPNQARSSHSPENNHAARKYRGMRSIPGSAHCIQTIATHLP
jgi:hypothetical protein